MATKFISDILRSVKDTADHANFLDELAEVLDSNPELCERIKKATGTMMPAGIIRGAATQLREYSKFMEDSVAGLKVDWPPQPAFSER